MIKKSKEEIIKIIKYVFASGTSFIIDLALFTVFHYIIKDHFPESTSIFISTIFARILSSLYNYFINSRVVFKSKKRGALIGYYILVIVQMIVSATLVSITEKYIKGNVTLIKFIIDIMIFIVNYIVQRNIIFKETKKEISMKKYISPIIFISFLFVFLISGIYSYKVNEKNYYKDKISTETYSLYDKNTYEFQKTNEDLNNITIKFQFDDNISVKSKIYVKLYDEDEKVIKSKTIKVKNLNNSKEYKYKVSKQKIVNGLKYKLVIDTNDEKLNENIKINSITNMYYEQSNKIFFVIIASLVTIITIILELIVEKKNIKIEKLYVILAIAIYGMFILFFPLFTAHDELYHWFRAYEISEGNMLSDINEGKALTKLPYAVSEVHNKEYYEINYRTLKNTIDAKLVEDNRAYHDMSAVALYSPVQYMPQSIGIFIARLFTDRMLIMAYMGRAMNALFAIVLIYFSIKIIPFGKRLLFTIAFLPIAIEGFTSLSADAITISISMFLISYILSIIYDKNHRKITKKDYIIILISSIILSLCKIVYIPLVLLPFLIPMKKFKNKKEYIIFTITIALISISCNLIWLKIASKYLNLYSQGKVAVSTAKLNPAGQVKNVLTHPFNYLSMLIYTFFTNFKSYIMSMLGDNLGWGEVINPLSIVPIAYLSLLTINSVFDKNANKKLDLKNNIMFGFISLCVIGLIFTSLYVQFTPPGSKTILGVQGRYFIPVLPLLLLLATNFKNIYSPKSNLDKFTYKTCLLLNYSIIFTLIIKFL